MRTWGPLVAAVIGLFLAAVAMTTPPRSRGLETPAAAFSAARAMADVREIGHAPHPTGSADNARVRAYLVARLRGLGLQVRETAAPLSDIGAGRLARWSKSPARPPVVNIVATLPGTGLDTQAVLLLAHYDSVWGSPGAADDAAGVASTLEVVRAVRASAAPMRRPLAVVFTDGEELGLEGGRSLFTADPDRRAIGVVVNMETRGGGGRAAMFETGRDNGAMMRLFANAVHHPSATSLSVFIYEKLPNSTDYTVAKRLGIPGFNFAFIGRPEQYHSPLATPDRLDQGALQDMGGQVLDLTRALLAADRLPGRAPSLTFFDVFGLGTFAYPPAWGWLVIGAAALLWGVAAWRSGTSTAMLARGALMLLTVVLLGGGLLYLINLLSGADGPVNYYDRLAAVPRLQLQAALIGVATLTLALGWSRRDRAGTAAGVALPLLLVGAAAQALAPTAAFVFAWPLLLGGAGAASGSRWLSAAAAAAAGGWLLGLAFFLYQAVGGPMPWVAALPLALLAPLIWPLVPPFQRRRAHVFAGVLLLTACVVALTVRLDPVSPYAAVYSR